MKSEVDNSYALLQIGEKTDLSKQIENTIDNPISSIFDMSCNIDNQIKEIIDRIVKAFLKQNTEVVQQVYRTKTAMNDLHYSIVLKTDDVDSRSKLFGFFDQYDLMDISSKYPVYFQFVPTNLIEKVYVGEKIEIEN